MRDGVQHQHGRNRVLGRALAGLTLLVCGCTQPDRACVARIAGIIARKARDTVTRPNESLPKGWQTVRVTWDELTLETRVRSRLRWDKSLTELPIEVKSTTGGVVELTGRVPDIERRQRAVQLALATVGVERVEDRLAVP